MVLEIQKSVQSLQEILVKHAGCDDPLSQKIKRWGLESMEAAANSPPQQLAEVAEACIKQLNSQVLVDSLEGRCVNNVVVERGYVWSRETHEICKRHFKNSPFDGEPIEESPHAHPLANEVIAWVRALNPTANEPVCEELPLTHYERLVGVIVREREQRELEERLAVMLSSALCEADRSLANTQKILEIERAQAAEHVKKLEQQIEELNSSHSRELALIEEQLAFLDTQYQENVSSLTRERDSIKEFSREKAEQLEKNVADITQAHDAEGNAIKAQMESSKERHEESLRALSERLTQAEKIRDEQHGQIENWHRHAVNAEASAKQLAQETKRVKAESEVQAQQFQSEIESLSSRLINADQQIRELQDEVDDRLCSIM